MLFARKQKEFFITQGQFTKVESVPQFSASKNGVRPVTATNKGGDADSTDDDTEK